MTGSPSGNNPPRVIEVIVSPAGQTRIETKGFTGSACKQATRALEQALGLIESDRTTAEFHQGASESASNQQQAG